MAREFDLLRSRMRTPQEEIDRRFPGPYDFLPGQEGVGEPNRRIFPGERSPRGYMYTQNETTGSALPPSLGAADRPRIREAIPSGSPEQIGAAAGAMPQPAYMETIQRLLNSQRIPGRQSGGPVAPGRPYVVGESGPEVFIPQGFKFDEGPSIPQGFKFDEKPSEGKVGRFLETITPEGPISGLIALIRTVGQAAQGRRPDLLISPEGAIPEVVQGAIAGTSARALAGPRAVVAPRPEPPPAPVVPRQLTYQPDIEAQQAAKLAQARLEAKQVAGRMRAEGTMPPEASGAPIAPPAQPGQVPAPPPPSPLLSPEAVREFMALRKGVELKTRLNQPPPEPPPPPPPEPPSSLLPSQTIREFGAVRKGVELKTELSRPPPEPPPPPPAPPPSSLLPSQVTREFGAVRKGVELKAKLDPSSPENISAATRPHVNSILASTKRDPMSFSVLDAAIPDEVLQPALKQPAKVASIANWMRIYERASRAKFSVQAKAALEVATRNLNNNLGTKVTLEDILGGK
jgi:hypothetical protein